MVMKRWFSAIKSIFLKNAAFRIAFIYAGFSTLWILFSDQIVLFYFKEAEILTRIQIVKGWFFILITALIIYSLLHKEITELKRTEGALHLYQVHLEKLVKERTQTLEQEIVERQRAEKRFRDLLEGAPDAMALVDPTGRIVLVNRQMEKLFGYSREELLERNIEVLVPERFRERHREHVKDYFDSFRARPMGAALDIYALPKDGREFPADISLSPLDTREGMFVLADIRDISERKEAEEKIKKSFYFESTINSVLKISLEPQALDRQLERILDLILAIPLLSLQKIGSIYLVEEQAEMLAIKAHRGYDEAVLAECSRVPFGKCLCGEAAATSIPIFSDCLADCHRCYQDIFPHGHYCIPIVSGRKVLGVLNLVLKEGHKRDKHEEEFLSSIAATLAGIIEHRKTESEKERLQAQLVESEKLSALGRMMENVAHEIRNPLTVVGGLSRRLDKKIPAGTKEKEYAGVILSESARLERILKSILLLTKEPGSRMEEYDIHEVIDESLRSFDPSFTEKSIEIRKVFAVLPPVLMDRENVREVMENLLANAVYAAPAGGKITIVTERAYLDETDYVAVKVTDTGQGIAPDIVDRIFEPFFTTKPVGPDHGIGLGLSISRKIMEEHGGFIQVESKAGEGATFSLFFPHPRPLGANSPN